MGSEAVASLRATLVNRARMSTQLNHTELKDTQLKDTQLKDTEPDGTELNGTEQMAPRVDHNSDHG